ncbi:hypothetical protein Glove_187g89 [Diversispora epigaea]|uniref:Transmembrane protein n=1 Tax=Diversispora epigaea TaxID=1348612 RepID=A0A397ILQ0_9GLOM|nr:hypothetical protein Glove_187g89 [Diversispora epigaea]
MERFKELREDIKKDFNEKWEKITASPITKLYLFMSILQTIVVSILQIRVFIRNYGFIKYQISLYEFQAINKFKCEIVKHQFPYIPFDNAFYIFFQLFQLYFSFDSVIKQHTIQIITITALNFAWALYGIVQVLEIIISINRILPFSNCLHQPNFYPHILAYDFPSFLLQIFFAIMMTMLSYRFSKFFGWELYKKIGGNYELQKIYQNRLIFIMLLKITFFFLILLFTPFVAMTTLKDRGIFSQYLPYVIFHSFTTALSFILMFVAFRSVSKESRKGLTVFLLLWSIVIIDFIIILVGSIQFFRSVGNVWIFLIILLILLLLLSVFLVIYGVKVLSAFDSGLKELLTQKDKEEVTTTVPLNQIWDDLEIEIDSVKEEKKWTIDDE